MYRQIVTCPILALSPSHSALDAFIASILGRNPMGGCRRANRLSCRFVSLVFLPPAGTCSLRPSPCLQPAEPAPLLTTAGAGSAKAGGQALGATLRAAVAVQIVCPDNLSLNHSHRYAFGRRHPLATKILSDHRIHWWDMRAKLVTV